MPLPRISIVTPSFNQVHFIETTILSVLEQRYPDLEYILMDGGSTDGSLTIIEKYAPHFTYWQSQPDTGQVDAINSGFARATGQVFYFLNSDDFLLQDALNHVADLYQQHSQAAAWVGAAHYIAEDGYILATRRPPRALERDDIANWVDNWIYQPGCFFSGEIGRRAGMFNPAYEHAFPFDFWLRLAALGKFVSTPQILAAARVHRSTKTLSNLRQGFEEVQAIQRLNGYDLHAQSVQKYIDRAQGQTSTATLAKLLYETRSKNRRDARRFVRLPGTSDSA